MAYKWQHSPWRFALIYWVVGAVFCLSGGFADPFQLSYRASLVTLPWSAASYAIASITLGWTVITIGFVFNTLLLLYIGTWLSRNKVTDAGSA